MSPYYRAFTTICLFAPLVYIYWCLLATHDTIGGFRGWSGAEDVLNRTLGFQKIYVINLPSRSDRRDAMALAGAFSNLTFTWIDGVPGDQVADSIAPGSGSPGAKGSWRSHMNALQAVVRDNLESALIIEDDIDWDIRLKSQLQTFSLASRTWLRESRFHKRHAELLESAPPSLHKRRSTTTMGADSEKNTIQLTSTNGVDDKLDRVAYGDDWDVLWLGHCGADFPNDLARVSPLKVAISGDETVPAPKHLKPHPFALQDKLGEVYPPHTRVVHASSGNVCSLAYAVSNQGAQKLLLEFNNSYDAQWDLMLQRWCERKSTKDQSPAESEPNSDGEALHEHREVPPVCLTVQPPLFSHRYAEGGASDIQGEGGGYAKGTGTPYIRLSVRENMKNLVTGMPESEMTDQLPDDGKAIWK
ncbi:glycosyltransferase family 25 protein [Jackrogersella minutella]|nr:glycosyltransferase family 25 protein [Jackrogersella minutella]